MLNICLEVFIAIYIYTLHVQCSGSAVAKAFATVKAATGNCVRYVTDVFNYLDINNIFKGM